MNRKFECHITILKPTNTSLARTIFKVAGSNNFKCSWITGDPVLGAGKWFYISGYAEDYNVLLERMLNVSKELKVHEIGIIREKIEEILYDTKTDHFVCGVNCHACLI